MCETLHEVSDVNIGNSTEMDLEAWLRTVAGMLHTSRVCLEISVSETVISDRVSVPDKSIIQAVQTLSRDHISLKVAGKVVVEFPDWTSLRVGFGERQRKLTVIKNLSIIDAVFVKSDGGTGEHGLPDSVQAARGRDPR